MVQRLPPLKAIEAFVMVAEASSFSKAALDLNITKSAVSRRIQSLEDDLGLKLFRRTAKGLTLTADGDAYFKITGPAFDALRTAGAQLDQPRRSNRLRVALPQSFASSWLIPRMGGFYQKYPDTDLQLDSLGYFSLLDNDNVDVALQVAREPPASVHAERLISLSQFPVCSPKLSAGRALQIDDIAAHTLLHLNTAPTLWPEWFELVGRPDLINTRSQRFDTMSLAIDAAANGLGFAMGGHVICQHDIDRGRLVAPFPQAVEGLRSIYFVCRKRDVSNRMVRRFRTWLFEQTQA